jgi:hypothetical protein
MKPGEFATTLPQPVPGSVNIERGMLVVDFDPPTT